MIFTHVLLIFLTIVSGVLAVLGLASERANRKAGRWEDAYTDLTWSLVFVHLTVCLGMGVFDTGLYAWGFK